jgi:internalin A
LLNYLHRSGVVFYRPKLMNRIVLDQAWALEAIYAVFEREGGAYKRIRGHRGRFTLADLTSTAWRGRGDDERALFLDMMRACGVGFRLDRYEPEDETTRYIAPELLPERANVEADIARDWDTGQPIRERIYRYKFLHDGLIRALIAGIGDIAGPEAVYWRDGVTVYETTTRARARLEQTTNPDASGAIMVQTRGGDAEALLARLCERVEQTQAGLGLEGAPDAPAPPAAPEKTPMDFGRDPAEPPRCYVSYAWADENDPAREVKVDELCDAADKRGFKIIRDKDAMKRGDSISAFMERIGEGDRVYVFLSDKYLKSEFCMYELYAIWRRSGQDKDEFKRRVRLYKLDDAKIGSLRDRLPYANYWDDDLKAIRAALQGRDPTLVLGESGAKDYRRLSEFASHVVDILQVFADTLQARSFEEFVEHGFEGLPK